MAVEVIKTIKSSGGDYVSLEDFIVGEARDLVTANEHAVAEIYTDTLVNYVDFRPGWTTDDDHRIILRCPTDGNGNYIPEYYHAGVPGSGVKLDTDGGNYSIIPHANMTLQGLEITQSSATHKFIDGNTIGNTVRSEDLLIHTLYGYTDYNEYAKNCLFYTGTLSSSSGTVYLRNGLAYNCTAYADGVGGYNGEIIFYAVECYATIIYNTTIGGYGSFYQCTGDYNACNDTSAPGANSLNNISDPFVDSANDDFTHLLTSVLTGAGPTVPYVLTDIVGVSRPQGTNSDIGVYEAVDSGGEEPNLMPLYLISAQPTKVL